MTLFVLRLRDGNCVVVAAGDDAAARQRVKNLMSDVEIATVRELESFAAQFLLTDDGELKSILLDEQTLADLRAHEYPILNSARTQSYADFNSSETDSKAEHVLYDALTQKSCSGKWLRRSSTRLQIGLGSGGVGVYGLRQMTFIGPPSVTSRLLTISAPPRPKAFICSGTLDT